MNSKQLCFISCVSDSEQYEQALHYQRNLHVPDGFTIEWISIGQAESMTSGYNSAMKRSEAKYKVYVHQDVYIIHPYFLDDLILLFENNEQLGMVGVAGATTIPANGIWWESPYLYGKVYSSHSGRMHPLEFRPIQQAYERVRAIDGLIMATQIDLPWREDLFTGWHFYDTSQSMEMLKAGYEVGVWNQPAPWCIHDCGIANLEGYEQYRQLFIEHYGSYLS
ncbi:Glycosyltransferase like family protein [Paenibacillus sp. 1_12]|uniref:glycosyltransferase family protein n=1 Tax=Paenibacillus sp. 1_12 TaxID=1566278 RepID=UPI0008E06DDD|nr:glycosyltransferase family protein [Paenibacillus sp. 1_12]SFK72219.1 Glycosyltransferase like family protein [Paenibacillus sp. 1_12]